MDRSLLADYERLRGIIKDAGVALVAFSGGVDSAFLLKVCVDELGEKVLAATARSESFPARELEQATDLALRFGARHLIIDSEELDLPGFSDNPPHRCFLCKGELFSKLKEIADAHGIPWVFDGSNADDGGDFRPGRMAARKLGVRSPLEEAGLGKGKIRALSHSLGLPTWDKPSFACLASRFPYHTRITREALKQVDNAEQFLWQLGMRTFRVRHHETVARIELGEREMQLMADPEMRRKVAQQFKSLGYTYVTLDLEGYRTGSMNETLSEEERGRASS